MESIISFSQFENKTHIKGFKSNIEDDTINNSNFRKVLYTGEKLQLVLMSLKGEEEIGEEVHKDNDQFFRFESGNGIVIINDTEYNVSDGDAVIIPAGSKHNIINLEKNKELKMYTIYTPPHHKDKIVKKTKLEAENSKEEFDGKTSE